MVRRQLAEGATAEKQQSNEDRASEISKITENPEQHGLSPTGPSLDGRYGQVHIVAGKQLSVRKDDNHQADAKKARCDHRTHGNVAKVLLQHPEHEYDQSQTHSCAHCAQHVSQGIILQQADLADTRIGSLLDMATVNHVDSPHPDPCDMPAHD